jgi:catechol 2,3-dioxygenase-like lactoylglutathione lyase family enzyme
MSRHLFASTPLLVCTDVDRVLDFFVEVLGYREPVRIGTPAVFAMAHRDEHDIMLRRARPAVALVPNAEHGAWDLHLRVEDLDAEITALAAAGVALHAGPRDTEYGMREIEILSPEGHLIALGQDHERRPEDIE